MSPKAANGRLQLASGPQKCYDKKVATVEKIYPLRRSKAALVKKLPPGEDIARILGTPEEPF